MNKLFLVTKKRILTPWHFGGVPQIAGYFLAEQAQICSNDIRIELPGPGVSCVRAKNGYGSIPIEIHLLVG
jgi:hypothetical protein